MDKTIGNITKILTIIIMAAGVVFTGLVMANQGDMKEGVDLTNKILNPFFDITYFTMGLAIFVVLFFAVAQLFMTPKAAVKTIASIVILGVLYLVAYLSASGNIDAKVYQDFSISSGESKLIGSLIYLVYILGGLSILSIIYSAINSFLLKR